jgi:hypothetical protein
MHVHENANRDINENARCNAAMQINPGLNGIFPGAALRQITA